MLAVGFQTGQEGITFRTLVNYGLNIFEARAFVCMETVKAVTGPIPLAVKPKVYRGKLVFALKQSLCVVLDQGLINLFARLCAAVQADLV